MKWADEIEQSPGVMGGKPVVRGTRITVQIILERLAGGYSEDDLLAAYPHITRGQIRSCIAFAAAVVADEETVFLERAPA